MSTAASMTDNQLDNTEDNLKQPAIKLNRKSDRETKSEINQPARIHKQPHYNNERCVEECRCHECSRMYDDEARYALTMNSAGHRRWSYSVILDTGYLEDASNSKMST